MKIRLTDLFELVFHVNTNIDDVLKKIFLYFSPNIKDDKIYNHLSLLEETGSRLVDEGLELNFKGKRIRNCSIWLRRNKEKDYLVEINFIFKDIQENYKEYFDCLKELAINIAERCSIKNYYCGLEPVDDIDNQYFSDNGYGCLFNKLVL